MRNGFVLSLGFLVAITAPALHAQSDKQRIETAVDVIKSTYNARNFMRLYQQIDAPARSRITATKFVSGMEAEYRAAGKIVSIKDPVFFPDAVAIYRVRFERDDGELRLQVDNAGRLKGLELEIVSTKATNSKVALSLPFDGRWIVEDGGDRIEDNYHQSIAITRNAFDFRAVDAGGRTHTGDGKNSSDWFSFGKDIMSPADGVVTDVVNGVRDNVPGELNNFVDIGNVVIIRHETGEFSVLAHLKFGSIRVKPGDAVKRGQIVGLCGNSGNSASPHLHYQLQATALPKAEGTIRALFGRITVERGGVNQVRTRYVPTRGDIISPVR